MWVRHQEPVSTESTHAYYNRHFHQSALNTTTLTEAIYLKAPTSQLYAERPCRKIAKSSSPSHRNEELKCIYVPHVPKKQHHLQDQLMPRKHLVFGSGSVKRTTKPATSCSRNKVPQCLHASIWCTVNINIISSPLPKCGLAMSAT